MKKGRNNTMRVCAWILIGMLAASFLVLPYGTQDAAVEGEAGIVVENVAAVSVAVGEELNLTWNATVTTWMAWSWELHLNGTFVDDHEGGQHTVTVLDITATTAIIVIESTPQVVNLVAGTEQQIDTDGDGTPDLAVLLVSTNVAAGTVEMTIRSLVADTTTEEGSGMILIIIGVIAVVAVLGVVLLIMKSRGTGGPPFQPASEVQDAPEPPMEEEYVEEDSEETT